MVGGGGSVCACWGGGAEWGAEYPHVAPFYSGSDLVRRADLPRQSSRNRRSLRGVKLQALIRLTVFKSVQTSARSMISQRGGKWLD